MSQSDREATVIRAFKRQNFSIGPEAITFLEDMCDAHGIQADQLDAAIKYFVDEYAKQDDASMKVSLPILQRIYDAFQASQDDTFTDGRTVLDPDMHLQFIDAFDMPAWHWSIEKSSFDRQTKPLTFEETDTRIQAMRDRLHVIRQVIMRNEHFTASAIPSKDRDKLLELRSTKDLLGRAGSEFLLCGMITHSQDGSLCLEDLDGQVKLDLTSFEKGQGPGEGFFTDGCIALVEGEYTDEEILIVHVIGHPPCERRETARSVHGHIDFLGTGPVTLLEETEFSERLKEEHLHLSFFAFSDLWLDNPQTLTGLKSILESCIENAFIPKVFIFCGNFCSTGVVTLNGKDVLRYQELFDSLADLLVTYPTIANQAHFLFVPGPLDLTESPPDIMPRRRLLPSITSKLQSKLAHAHFLSNPCRILFCGQEIVIFRDDAMARILRNSLFKANHTRETELKHHLVQTILDQSHLSPVNLSLQAVYWNHDHALRLYPMPSAMILADRFDRYELTYEGTHVFNPGSFLGNSCGFSTYFPSRRRSEASEIISPALD